LLENKNLLKKVREIPLPLLTITARRPSNILLIVVAACQAIND